MFTPNNLSFVSIKNLPEWKEEINAIQMKAEQGWIWNTNEMFEFREACLRDKYEVIDLSFVVYLDDKAIGFFFMLAFKDAPYFTAGFSAAPLYWPCLLDEYNTIDIISSTFSYIDKLCIDNNVGVIKIMSKSLSIRFKMYCYVLSKYKYLDESYESHVVIPKQFTLSDLRPKYRQMIKKYEDKFFIKILNVESINDNIIQQYYHLHILNSGRKHRDISTYVKQFDIFKRGGFLVCAFNKNTEAVGMLQILYDKKESVEASVAVHPEFKEYYISHLLKYHAIENMKKLDIDLYELGPTSYYSTWGQIATEKNYGINLFKDGWSRGKTRKTYSAIKFYTHEALNDYFIFKKKEIETNLYRF